MKTRHFLTAALLGLGFSVTAHAQTPAMATPGTAVTPASPTTNGTVPGRPNTPTGALPTGTVPASATTPISTTGTVMYPNGVPARNVDAGTQRADQPVGTPVAPGTQPTRRLNQRRSTTSSTSTTRP